MVFLFLLSSLCCVAAVDPLSPLSLSLARLQPKPPLRQNNAAGSNPKASSDEANNRRATEPFADDVRRLRELRRAERAAAASAPPHQRLAALARRLWLQYLITWAAYCFDWWERLVVHACLITVAGLMLYGVSLGARAARAAAAVARRRGWRSAAEAEEEVDDESRRTSLVLSLRSGRSAAMSHFFVSVSAL